MESSVRDRFFVDRDFACTILAYVPNRSGFCVMIPGGIISVIHRLIREDHVEATTVTGDTITLEWDPFDGLVKGDDGNFTLYVKHKEQFETILRVVKSIPSFHAVVDIFATFTTVFANAKLGHVTQEIAARSVRFVVAMNLKALRVILEHVWGLSVLVDGATHALEGYLDIRLSFECTQKLFNFHFLSLPTGELSHTSANSALLTLDALTNVWGAAFC